MANFKKKYNTQNDKLTTVLFFGKIEIIDSVWGEVRFKDVKFTPHEEFQDLETLSMTLYEDKTVMGFVDIIFQDIQLSKF